MIYNKENIYQCIFIERLNRFVAKVILNEEEILVHVKNTGRCKELLIKGSKGYLVKSNNEKRKYMYDLVSIYKDNLLINIDSQIPNKVVFDFIKQETIFKNIINIKREVTYKNSRFDIYLEYLGENKKVEKAFIEVKGVTLFDKELAKFPDAPTVRGTKHLDELVDAYKNGYKAFVFFLIQAEGLKYFSGNNEMDELFCNALKNAYKEGVQILCFDSKVSSCDIKINKKVEILL